MENLFITKGIKVRVNLARADEIFVGYILSINVRVLLSPKGDINLHSNQINIFRHILFQIFAGIPDIPH